MAPSKTTTDDPVGSITLTKKEAAAIREGLLGFQSDFKANWTQVGTAIGLTAPRNGGRAFKDAITKISLELKDGSFYKIATDNDAAEDEAVKESKGAKGKKRKGDAGEEGAGTKKTKME